VYNRTDIVAVLDKAVTYLCNVQTAEGAWSDFIASPTEEGTEWITAEVGWFLNHLPQAQAYRVTPHVDAAKNFLLRSRRPTGGWGFCEGAPIGADSIGYCLLFLLPLVGGDGIGFRREKEILMRHCRDDGGFGTYLTENWALLPSTSGYYASTPCVTASSALGLSHFPNGTANRMVRNATEYLLTRQHSRGYWDSMWWDNGIYSSFIVAHFLQHMGRGQAELLKTVQWLQDTQDRSGCWHGSQTAEGVPFVTSIALETLLILGVSVNSDHIRGGVTWLLQRQQGDGSWESFPLMKFPPPAGAWRPEEAYEGAIVAGRRGNFATAATVSLFSRFLSLPCEVPGSPALKKKGVPSRTLSYERERQKIRKFDPSLASEILKVLDQSQQHLDSLPFDLEAIATSSSIWKEIGPGLGVFLPFWLDEEFAQGNLIAEARQMALANRFGQIFCLVQDSVIDRDPRTKPEILILLNDFFFQFVHIYQQVFPSSHPFWGYFYKFWQEYLEALAREKVRHNNRNNPYTPEDFLWIGRKMSPLKICVAGMALLADRKEAIPVLSAMIEGLHAGYQLLDDLRDWRDDLDTGSYTYLLSLLEIRPSRASRDGRSVIPSLDEVQRQLQCGGVAVTVLEKASDFLSDSLLVSSDYSLPKLKVWMREIHKEIRQRRELIEGNQDRSPKHHQSKC